MHHKSLPIFLLHVSESEIFNTYIYIYVSKIAFDVFHPLIVLNALVFSLLQ